MTTGETSIFLQSYMRCHGKLASCYRAVPLFENWILVIFLNDKMLKIRSFKRFYCSKVTSVLTSDREVMLSCFRLISFAKVYDILYS